MEPHAPSVFSVRVPATDSSLSTFHHTERVLVTSSKPEFSGGSMGETPWVLRAIDAHTNHMKTIVTQYSFVDSFRAHGRENQFSYPALRALFEYFEAFEEETDTELELDPIAICCEWQEFSTALEGAKAFGYLEGVDSKDETPLEWLENRTQALEFTDGVVVRVF
jgi:hypothetical protein